MNLLEMRHIAEIIARVAIEAVKPEKLVYDMVKFDNPWLAIGSDRIDLRPFRKIIIVGAGKATASMAHAVEDILKDRVSEGIIVVPEGPLTPLRHVKIKESSHPLPDGRGVAAAKQILSLLMQNAQTDVLVLCLISGGGSSLLPYPADGVSLSDKQTATRLLLQSGASISELNTVRKHLSKIKGGQLARAAYPARVVSLILSDVVGDRLDTIASGLTAPDASTFADAAAVFQKYKICGKAPQSVQQLLQKGVRGEAVETPKADDPCFSTVNNFIIGNNRKALQAASEEARSQGFRPLLLSSCLTGEAREVGTLFASIAKEVEYSRHPVAPPACLLAGGETTVTVLGSGKGGRNQEAALSAAISIADAKNIVILAIGTDGADGPTDAAGAIVDTTSIDRAVAAGLDPVEYLIRNDSYPLHEKTGDLVKTGPTGTNVMDLLIGLIS
jgi:glycerate 2-kinase